MTGCDTDLAPGVSLRTLTGGASVNEELDQGHAALEAGDWQGARQAFAAMLADTETAQALEGLSWAAWWLEDAGTCLEARERAYRLYREHGDLRGAARMAVWLSDDYEVFRGDSAVANGWLRRSQRLLEDLEPGPEHAWMVGLRAYGALVAADTVTARRLSSEAQELGRAHGVADLELLGLAIEGAAFVDEGQIDKGMSRLDEAATGALAGECKELAGAAYTCCLVVSACDRVRDIGRAAQWCHKIEDYSRRMGIRFVHGSCQAYYASVLVWSGDWKTAERQLEAAVGELTDTRPAWYRAAVVRLAELRRRQGRLAEAEDLFRQVEFDPLARLGLAEIRFDRGDLGTARTLLEQALRSIPPEPLTARIRPVERVRPLELMIRVDVAAGQFQDAEEHLHALRELVAALPITWPHAAARFAEGTVAAAVGDLARARQYLGSAVELFAASGAPFETARTRLELATVLQASDRSDAAAHEATAAERSFAKLGAASEHARAVRFLEQLGVCPARRVAPGPLTTRQLEVLELIAKGHSDRQIARELVVSEHTVHRHVANILTRFGCSSRSAAVAEAAHLGLLDQSG